MTEQEREELIEKIERDALREENAGLRADLATEKEQGWKAHAANLSLEEDNHALREELTAMERRARIFESANKKMLADNKRLREENARLLAALKPFADKYKNETGTGYTGDEYRAAAAAIRRGKHD